MVIGFNCNLYIIQWKVIIYDAQFRQLQCSERLVEKLLLSKSFFGDLKVEWLSYIKLDKIREAQIQSCFKYEIEFNYPKNVIEFEDIIEEFKVRSKASETIDVDNELNHLTSFYGENKKKRLTYCYE